VFLGEVSVGSNADQSEVIIVKDYFTSEIYHAPRNIIVLILAVILCYVLFCAVFYSLSYEYQEFVVRLL